MPHAINTLYPDVKTQSVTSPRLEYTLVTPAPMFLLHMGITVCTVRVVILQSNPPRISCIWYFRRRRCFPILLPFNIHDFLCTGVWPSRWRPDGCGTPMVLCMTQRSFEAYIKVSGQGRRRSRRTYPPCSTVFMCHWEA